MAVTDHFNNYSLLFILLSVYQENSKRARQKKFLAWQVWLFKLLYDKHFSGLLFKKCLIIKNFQTFLTNFFCTNFDLVHTAMTSGQKSCNKCGEFCLTDVMNIPISSTKLI